MLKRAGRKRGIESEADRIREVFRAKWAHQPQLDEGALGKEMLALLRQLEAACTAAEGELAKDKRDQRGATAGHGLAGRSRGVETP